MPFRWQCLSVALEFPDNGVIRSAYTGSWERSCPHCPLQRIPWYNALGMRAPEAGLPLLGSHLRVPPSLWQDFPYMFRLQFEWNHNLKAQGPTRVLKQTAMFLPSQLAL